MDQASHCDRRHESPGRSLATREGTTARQGNRSTSAPDEGASVESTRSRNMRDSFRQLAERTAHAVGSARAFMLALLTIAVWGVTGPYFNYSDTWQLFINTGTTI